MDMQRSSRARLLSPVPHSMPKKLKAGERSSFMIELDSPIDEEGFLQIDLSWGFEEEIEPNPITVECREQKHS